MDTTQKMTWSARLDEIESRQKWTAVLILITLVTTAVSVWCGVGWYRAVHERGGAVAATQRLELENQKLRTDATNYKGLYEAVRIVSNAETKEWQNASRWLFMRPNLTMPLESITPAALEKQLSYHGKQGPVWAAPWAQY